MSKRSSFGHRLLTAALLGLGAYVVAKKTAQVARCIDLQGRTVLITGGSRGLGLALAREFSRHKARVAICARDTDELAAARADLQRMNDDVHTFTCDLTDGNQIANMIDEVEKTCGPIDVLVNNAGTIMVGPAQVMTIEDFQQAIDVNFWAAARTTLAVMPRMRSRRFGRIVNIASVGGKMPVPHLAPYCASKFALVGFSGSMRVELAKDGILVTTVNPGLLRTGSPRNAKFKGKQKAEYAWFSISDALPGLSMSVADAARRIVRSAITGKPEVTLGLPAKVASTLYGVMPQLTLEMSALANRALPNAGKHDTGIKTGAESESWITRKLVPATGRRAEQENNQLGT